MAVPVFGALDILGDADWEVIGSDLPSGFDRATSPTNEGDIAAEKAFHEQTVGSCKAHYIGEEVTIAAALEASDFNVGNIVTYNTTVFLLITGVSVDYSPCKEGGLPEVTFSLRVVSDAAGVYAIYKPTLATAAMMPPTAGVATAGIPALFANSNADSDATAATYALTAQWGESQDGDGDTLAGNLYQGEETVNMTHRGIPTLTTTGYIVTTQPLAAGGGAASNTDYADFQTTAVKAVARTPPA
jgi:hypothetical protein